ncbi:anaerobic selenocysteine-containing dehydrogenase [Spinactinospora alkalitolerans]|uniref:Anaerobic selenocysteine-containing dehydrogenase n=1 Tax=Spinactinospora alkalitolerans TaxID=687207 RepID=A0A852TUF7_9ACTN|nr:molybdopterin oxidoreductase family protein [Spinactinospora alkalitolerans]NYE46937.1 anaerobic selenocysteine-containing dehydrogenase [Spinactinospora alkalitolerans]
MNDRIADPWGPRTPYGPSAPGADDAVWPERVDTLLEEGVAEDDVEAWTRAASILHSNGDAMDIAARGGRIVGVRGRADDRVNRGRLGPKDLYGWQANRSADRLTAPLIRKGGELVETDWDTAMERIVAHSKELLSQPGGWGRFGFYTSGQLFSEEYYTLGVIGKAGIGTPHMDGNTRLCTATAAATLKASFGTDGQPGSYTDVDHCDAIALWGHNVAETQTVLWARMLDRRRGPNPPRMLVVDPRRTPAAKEADLHLAVRNGTNQALMNALLHLVIADGRYDERYVREHTIGFERLRTTVADHPPERAAEICGVPESQIREAAELLGTSRRLLSTVLQGFYQSNQATAAGCQVNNLHLIRGMIGRPGAGVLQMNGQPTAQNTRETGADGDLPGLRNWENPDHIRELAELWNVDPMTIPHWAAPTHAMQIFRYAEQGSVKLLWISATNPAVSLPDLPRIRRILAKAGLMVVVQDLYLTETARFADVVLPAATWGEKLGTFTNADRTLHLCDKAVEPPGQARSDLDIFLDYARRMDLRNASGGPLITWHDPESAFEAWKECSRGRPCDQTGITYARLRSEGGIQWPCTDPSEPGAERLYSDGRFNTDPEYCETYGHDLTTGAVDSAEDYRAKEPHGRAFLHAEPYRPGPELTGPQYPLLLTTGRTVYHFHTRTKTGRTPQLREAAPDAWLEISAEDAEELGVIEGDPVWVESERGSVLVRARVSGIRKGVVFMPFHYGYWDHGTAGPDGGRPRAANELTVTSWDPVSKQPHFKVAAVRVTKATQTHGGDIFESDFGTARGGSPVLAGPAAGGTTDVEED